MYLLKIVEDINEAFQLLGVDPTEEIADRREIIARMEYEIARIEREQRDEKEGAK